MEGSKMKIGSLILENPVLLSPMSGVTHMPFRLICKEMGAGLVYTEFTSSWGLMKENLAALRRIEIHPGEHPVGAQIFGSDPVVLAEAARLVVQQGADLVDINMGCWVPKVVKSGSCAALLRDKELAKDIMSAVVQAVDVPVTIKMRKGWDIDGFEALEVAHIAEEAGVQAVTIHGRSAKQGFKGKCDWNAIAEIKKTVSIPVIANGDIFTPQDVVRVMEETGCDGLMLGRAVCGNPWLFREINQFLSTGSALPSPGVEDRAHIILRHARHWAELVGEEKAMREMRKHFCWYVRGLRDAARLREKFVKVTTLAELENILTSFASQSLIFINTGLRSQMPDRMLTT